MSSLSVRILKYQFHVSFYDFLMSAYGVYVSALREGREGAQHFFFPFSVHFSLSSRIQNALTLNIELSVIDDISTVLLVVQYLVPVS